MEQRTYRIVQRGRKIAGILNIASMDCSAERGTPSLPLLHESYQRSSVITISRDSSATEKSH